MAAEGIYSICSLHCFTITLLDYSIVVKYTFFKKQILDYTAAEEAAYDNIRPFIRRVILPLVQVVYDENPSDEMQFCADYFNDLLRKRKSDSETADHQIPSYDGESNPKKEASMEYQYEGVESKVIPTNVQGSASAPLLSTGKLSETVNARETSSWDTPSKVTEPIKSLAVLEDAICGIGDQPSTKESQIAMENDNKAGDAVTSLKHDSFDENKIASEVIKNSAAEEYLKSCHDCKESKEEDLKILCTQFERMEFPKPDYWRHDDSDQEIAQNMDIKICRKQLSPNSSFGFVPQLDECDSLKDMTKVDSENSHVENASSLAGEISMIQSGIAQTLQNEPDSELQMGKIDSEDSHDENLTGEIIMISRKISDIYMNEHDAEKGVGKKGSEDSEGKRSKTHIEELSKIRRKVSETFLGLSDKISSAKVQFNDKVELIGGLQEENIESAMDFASKSDRISYNGNDFIEEKQNEMISNISDKCEMDDIKGTNNTCSGKVHPSESPFTQMCSFVRNMLDSEEKGDEDENTGVTGPMDFQKEYFPDKERSGTIVFIKDAEEDRDKSDEFEPQIVFEKLPRNVPVFIKSEKKEDEGAEMNFSKPMNSQQEKFADTEKSETADFEIDAENDDGKFGEFEPQIVFEKMPKSEPVSIKSEKRESQKSEKNVTESIESQQETSAYDKEKPENTVEAKKDFTEQLYSQQKLLSDEFKSFVRKDAKDDNDKYKQSEPQIVVQKPWRRKLFEVQPSLHKSKNFQSEKGDEGAKKIFVHQIDFLGEKLLDKENPKITTSRIEAADDHGKSDRSEPQIVVFRTVSSLRRRWNDVDRNIPPGYSESRGEDLKKNFAKSTDSKQENFSDEEKRETTLFEKGTENDYDKPNQTESEIVVDEDSEEMRKQWPEARPPLHSFSSFIVPRLNRALHPAPRPNFEEAGDVPPDRFYIPNSYMNCRRRYQNTSESSRGIAECNFSGSYSNEIRRRSNSSAPSYNSFERQKQGEKKSNANPQSVLYSGEKLCKQSHLSENMDQVSTELQAKLNKDVSDSANFIKQESLTSLNDVEITSEIDINESEEVFFETSDGITDEANLGIKESEEKKLKQCEDVVKEDVSVVLTNDQDVMIRDKQEALSETNFSTNSKDKSQSNLYNQNIVSCDKNVTEEDKGKQGSIEYIKMENKCSDHNGVSLDAQNEKAVNNHTEILVKCGLDAACGDFVSSVNDVEQDDDYEIIVTEPDENEGNQAQQNNESGGGISMEYFEEVIGKVIEEQKYAHDDLNTSFYPESDSSYIEIEESSDFTDTDDSTIQEQ